MGPDPNKYMEQKNKNSNSNSNSNSNPNSKNILAAIEQICQEKNISKEQVLEAIEQALASAFRKDFGTKQQNLKINFHPENGKMEVFDEKTVVEDLPEMEEGEIEQEDAPLAEDKTEGDGEENEKKRFNSKTEIQISEMAKDSDWINVDEKAKKIKIGDVVRKKLEITSDFGRIAAQTAKQVIIQRLREAERDMIYEKYKTMEGTVINGLVQRRERRSILIDLNDATALLPYYEQVEEESYRPDQKIKIYILSVEKSPKGPEIIVSRRHPDILRELFKIEIPEVASGAVEIKGIAREAGFRSKIAVWTKEESIDPIGACIGQRGVRIQTIIGEIGGEKIDIIEYSESAGKFIVNSLAPAKVSSIEVNEKERFATVKIKRNQLSLAIGRDGQNVRLAAKLTGWRIDVQAETELEAEAKAEPENEIPTEVEKKPSEEKSEEKIIEENKVEPEKTEIEKKPKEKKKKRVIKKIKKEKK